MIKVKVDTLKTGDIIAEHIINSERQVLLSAGTVLSRKTITLLKLWEIKEIKLREATDTDDAVRLSLQFDEIDCPMIRIDKFFEFLRRSISFI